jgi:hypothetical protein
LREAASAFALTSAGISQERGIATFRARQTGQWSRFRWRSYPCRPRSCGKPTSDSAALHAPCCPRSPRASPAKAID